MALILVPVICPPFLCVCVHYISLKLNEIVQLKNYRGILGVGLRKKMKIVCGVSVERIMLIVLS